MIGYILGKEMTLTGNEDSFTVEQFKAFLPLDSASTEKQSLTVYQSITDAMNAANKKRPVFRVIVQSQAFESEFKTIEIEYKDLQVIEIYIAPLLNYWKLLPRLKPMHDITLREDLVWPSTNKPTEGKEESSSSDDESVDVDLSSSSEESEDEYNLSPEQDFPPVIAQGRSVEDENATDDSSSSKIASPQQNVAPAASSGSSLMNRMKAIVRGINPSLAILSGLTFGYFLSGPAAQMLPELGLTELLVKQLLLSGATAGIIYLGLQTQKIRDLERMLIKKGASKAVLLLLNKVFPQPKNPELSVEQREGLQKLQDSFVCMGVETVIDEAFGAPNPLQQLSSLFEQAGNSSFSTGFPSNQSNTSPEQFLPEFAANHPLSAASPSTRFTPQLDGKIERSSSLLPPESPRESSIPGPNDKSLRLS